MSSAPTVQSVQALPSSEEALVEQLLLGDPHGFAQLMRRYNQRLFRVARAITRDDVEAEDVVQQSYLAAFTHRDQFSGTAAFSTSAPCEVFSFGGERCVRIVARVLELAFAGKSAAVTGGLS